ncbi:ParB/RepB/Spo0J family partition protein [Paraburkholderia aspalathi]|uniref:ParB/RepB/Spo0J family partition protein n=1 Tax=Paraburkholderia aspalathi TaxID=1324617 RepID=UPI0038BE1A2B
MATMKNFASKAAGIKLTSEEVAAAGSRPVGSPRTAPGQLMHLQATAEQQHDEIERLKRALAERTAEEEVDLDLIDEVEGRRRKLSPEEYAELKANLERNPLITPVVLRRRPNGRRELVAGHNRTAIYRELGRPRIRAVTQDIADEDVSKFAFFSNLLAPSLSDFEKYWNFLQLQTETGLDHAALAEIAGISRVHVTRIMRYDALPEKAKEILFRRPERLGSTAAQALSQIAESGRTEAVIAAIEKLVNDETMTQEQAVSMARAKRPATAAPEKLFVKSGKRHICEISVRKGVVGVQFKGEDAESASDWAQRIREFIADQITSKE